NNIVINEALTHTDPPLEDAIELFNSSGSPVDISGWFLSDAKTRLKKYVIPQGTVIPAGGFKVFYEYQFNGVSAAVPFALSSAKGDDIFLSESLPGGNLT